MGKVTVVSEVVYRTELWVTLWSDGRKTAVKLGGYSH